VTKGYNADLIKKECKQSAFIFNRLILNTNPQSTENLLHVHLKSKSILCQYTIKLSPALKKTLMWPRRSDGIEQSVKSTE